MLAKLSQDQKDALFEAIDTDGIRAFMLEMEAQVKNIQSDVLKCSLDTDADEKILIRKRLRADGASTLLVRMNAALESLKTKQKR